MKKISRYIKNGSLYLFGELFQKASLFFMLPITTYYLSAEQFGRLNVYLSISEVIVFVCLLNLPTYIKLNYTENKGKLLLTNSLQISLLVGMFVQILLFIANYVFDIGYYSLVVFALFQVAYIMLISFMQAQEDFRTVFFYNSGLVLLMVGMSVFLMNSGFGVEGRIVGIFLPYLILFLFYFLSKENKIKVIERDELNNMFKFGVTLLPHNISWWVRSGFDRVALSQLLGFSQVGSYALANQMSMIIPITANVVNHVLLQTFYRSFREKSKDTRNVTTISVLLSLIVSLLCAFLLPNLKVLFDESYSLSFELIPYFVLVFFFQACVIYLNNWMIALELSKGMSVVALLSTVVYVALFYPFVLNFGIFGPIYASLIATILTLVLTLCFIKKQMG